MVIFYPGKNQLFFNDKKVNDLDALEQQLAAATEKKSNRMRARKPIIIINADKDVPYDDVVQILSIARKYASSVFLPTKTEKR